MVAQKSKILIFLEKVPQSFFFCFHLTFLNIRNKCLCCLDFWKAFNFFFYNSLPKIKNGNVERSTAYSNLKSLYTQN